MAAGSGWPVIFTGMRPHAVSVRGTRNSGARFNLDRRMTPCEMRRELPAVSVGIVTLRSTLDNGATGSKCRTGHSYATLWDL